MIQDVSHAANCSREFCESSSGVRDRQIFILPISRDKNLGQIFYPKPIRSVA